MPILTVKLPDKNQSRRIPFSPGRTVRDILLENDIGIRTACNGSGACGLCRIKITEGNAGEPSANERAGLGTAELSTGVRLACQVRAPGNLSIEILNPALSSVWRGLDEKPVRAPFPPPQLPVPDGERSLGAAVDLGTTHISIAVLDLAEGRRLSGRRGLNPQSNTGADVMTRLVRSSESPEEARRLSSQAIRAIGEGLREIGTRDGIDLASVKRVVIVGNTAMLTLLSLKNYNLLLHPRWWTEAIDCLPLETSSWAASWGISPETDIKVIPPLAGFVGSDLLSGVIATGLMERQPGALLIDFGTNSELALWDGDSLWVTSAAGGPAFEGSGLSCGMPADPGAVSRVQDSAETGGLSFEVLGGNEPRGLCGSGLVDLVASLVRKGLLNEKGKFAASVPVSGFELCRGVVLAGKDVDVFQRAKAAIGTALHVLLAKADMGYRDLRRICIGGVFGRYLNIRNAREIGLLPPVPDQLVETLGNTSLLGAEMLLAKPDAGERIHYARSRAKIINLSSCADFEALFMDNLYLHPIAGGDHEKLPTDHDQLKAFINATQYFAGLTAGQDIWEEAGKVLVTFFGADFAAFGTRRADGSVEIGHWVYSGEKALLPEASLIASMEEVFESGFLTYASPPADNPAAVAFFPVLHENRVIAVMLAGLLSSPSFEKKTLDLYLAVAGLIGAMYSRRLAEQAVLKAKEELEERVALRTGELESANKELERKIAEIERLNKAFVGREIRMIELKERIKELEQDIPKTKQHDAA